MAEHDDGTGAHQLGREFKAAKNVGIDEIARDAGTEDVADALVENQFRRYARIDAAEDRGERRLAVRGFVDLGKQIAIERGAGQKTRVAGLQPLDRLVRAGRLLPLRREDRAVQTHREGVLTQQMSLQAAGSRRKDGA